MSSIKTTDCYVPVDVKTDYVVKALWQSNCPYWTDTGCAKDYSCNCERDERFDTEKENTVEKKEGVIVLTVEQANKVFGEIWDAAHKREHEWNQYYYFEDTTDEKYRAMPDKETYIKSLLP